MDCPLFDKMTPEERHRCLSAGALAKTLPAGARLFLQGDRPDYFYILQSGAVIIEHLDADGTRVVLNRFDEAGTVFGEVYALLQGQPYDYTCRMQTAGSVLFMPSHFLTDDDLSCPWKKRLRQNMLALLAEKAHFLSQKTLLLSSKRLKEKIIKFICLSTDEHQLEMKLNRAQLADYFGIARPSLSRALMALQAEGLVTVKGSRLIFDRKRLERIIKG